MTDRPVPDHPSLPPQVSVEEERTPRADLGPIVDAEVDPTWPASQHDTPPDPLSGLLPDQTAGGVLAEPPQYAHPLETDDEREGPLASADIKKKTSESDENGEEADKPEAEAATNDDSDPETATATASADPSDSGASDT